MIDNKDKLIFPLSPEPHCETKTETNVDIYEEYLSKAFKEERIKNIAITGRFGIGKSSIIRSFDIKRAENDGKGESPRFLYVSLGSYSNYQESNLRAKAGLAKDGTDGGGDATLIEDEGTKDINITERRILLQIFSRFNQRDIPLSNFRFIQEKAGEEEKNWSFFFSVLLLDILFLFNYENIKQLFAGIKPFVEIEGVLHVLLYVTLFVQGFICMSRFFPWIKERMQVKTVNLKSDYGEIGIEKKAVEGYLDVYATDIVYCLVSVADQIDRTVVFEDMDRLRSEECLYLFMRLREINNLVNARIKNNKPIRFIYVVNDLMLGDIVHTKFFDYVMPVIPILNQKTAYAMFRENWQKINKNVMPADSENMKVGAEEEEFIKIICQYICDFRMQYSILNEYALLLSIYYKNNGDSDSVSNTKASIEILALSTYKNAYPKDYNKLYEGESVLFPERWDQMKEEDNPELLKYLADRLSISSLYYLGYGESQFIAALRESWKEMSDASLVNELKIFSFKESEEVIGAFIGFLSDKLNRYSRISWQSWKKTENILDEAAVVLWGEVIRVFSNRKNGIRWFFEGTYMENCLYIISEAIKMSKLGWFNRTESSGKVLYDYCKPDAINLSGQYKLEIRGGSVELTEGMLEEFCRAYTPINEVDENALQTKIIDESGKKVGECYLCESDSKIKEIRERINY